ncbi:MAG: RluA family pseudouridine synthase [Chloroflexota bacterium]
MTDTPPAPEPVIGTPCVVYEDDAVVVVDKPHGLVTHPAYRHPDGTLWDQLAIWFPAHGLDSPRLLHRLDRDTSGLLCVPKHLGAHRLLERALRAGSFRKEYLALVHGTTPAEGMIGAPLARDPANRRRVCVTPSGKAARTHFTTLRRFGDFSLLRLRLETGRTHQIRVHLASIGCPVAGDVVYGPTNAAIGRLFLHADRLSFPRVGEVGMVQVRAPLPMELRCLLHRLRAQLP